MQQCWQKDPKERPTMAQIVKWSKQKELKSLRIMQSLESNGLLCVCQCNVNHTNQNPIEMPLNFQSTIPNCESVVPLFSSLSSHSLKTKSTQLPDHRAKATNTQHIQIWVAQSDKDTSKLTIITFRSSDLGYWVSSCTMFSTCKLIKGNTAHHCQMS